MAKNKKEEVSTVRTAKHGWILTLIFGILSVVWILPILVVLLNSFKRKAFIFRYPFGISTAKLSDGWDAFRAGITHLFCGKLNYTNGLRATNFWDCFGNHWLGCTYHSVLLHVCMVYRKSSYNRNKDHVHTLPFFHDRTVPDGYVYFI